MPAGFSNDFSKFLFSTRTQPMKADTTEIDVKKETIAKKVEDSDMTPPVSEALNIDEKMTKPNEDKLTNIEKHDEEKVQEPRVPSPHVKEELCNGIDLPNATQNYPAEESRTSSPLSDVVPMAIEPSPQVPTSQAAPVQQSPQAEGETRSSPPQSEVQTPMEIEPETHHSQPETAPPPPTSSSSSSSSPTQTQQQAG